MRHINNWELACNVEYALSNTSSHMAFVRTKDEPIGRPIKLVDNFVRKEFGPCTFYLYSEKYDVSTIVRLDPFMGTIQFFNHDKYVNGGIISWEKPEKFKKLYIYKDEFFKSYIGE